MCDWNALASVALGRNLGGGVRRGANRHQRNDLWVLVGLAHGLVDSQEPALWRKLMGMFDEVLRNHELFGEHKGETHQTKDLHWLGGLLEKYEITPSGRLEFLEYTIEDRSDPTLKGIARLGGSMTMVFTGGRRDLDYHGWLYLSCFGRAKFTDGTMIAFESEPDQPGESEDPDEINPSKPVPDSANEAQERAFRGERSLTAATFKV
jgi:hypothetical protein